VAGQQALDLAAVLGESALQVEASYRLGQIYHSLGRLYHQTGRAEPARTALSAAINLYRAMDMTLWLPRAEAALVQVEGR
jgi:hypothetical protein